MPASGMDDKGRMQGPDIWLAGVDGCPDGWAAVFVRPEGQEWRADVVHHFADVISAPEAPAIVAVDIPIGLPERAGYGGRAAENAVRPKLGKRQSSVFSVPSRAAVHSETGPFADETSRYAAHRRASEIAQATSEPPRRIAIQAFGIFPKIREVDACLRADPALASRVFEVHPEVSFWRLNGEHELPLPKKIKGKRNEPGLDLRRRLLIAAGLPQAAIESPAPKGAGPDDMLDALAGAAVARRIYAGIAQPFPDPPEHDAFGLRMAIWA